ncbi:matrixin family metalloprotease [Nitrosopumilus sp.]|uniref:matrixin family metalloprotease n=1 Tax=Nitrosopumilus sp. TaxID=2024843 RepID=UPI00247CEC0D|nr:matrixin family metalloprotease [Nitrosopumilus sp.]MCV0430139.1 matrixin family metalloprotease [Nitrosopumilus sp.]
MKAVYVIIALVLFVGYVWYADLLPFSPNSSSVGLSPSVEKIQQISNAITDDHQIIYYSFENVPDVPDKQIPINALMKAIDNWENTNPNLEFIQSEKSNIEIKWQKYAPLTHTGLATCNSVLFGILSHCVLDISIGAEDCNSNFVQNDENMVVNILMHEIGHALGLGHTSEKNHLMYSTQSPEIDFNSQGYNVPERLDELYVGQKLLLIQEQELQSQIESLNRKINLEQSQYDEYLKQYEFYEGKMLSQSDYKKAQRALDTLNIQIEKVNALIDQQNDLIIQINDIINQLGCDPNFEVKSQLTK